MSYHHCYISGDAHSWTTPNKVVACCFVFDTPRVMVENRSQASSCNRSVSVVYSGFFSRFPYLYPSCLFNVLFVLGVVGLGLGLLSRRWQSRTYLHETQLLFFVVVFMTALGWVGWCADLIPSRHLHHIRGRCSVLGRGVKSRAPLGFYLPSLSRPLVSWIDCVIHVTSHLLLRPLS